MALSTEDENIAMLYRAMTTPQLEGYRALLFADRKAARASKGKRAKYSVDFSTRRITIIEHVLGGRGVVLPELT